MCFHGHSLPCFIRTVIELLPALLYRWETYPKRFKGLFKAKHLKLSPRFSEPQVQRGCRTLCSVLSVLLVTVLAMMEGSSRLRLEVVTGVTGHRDRWRRGGAVAAARRFHLRSNLTWSSPQNFTVAKAGITVLICIDSSLIFLRLSLHWYLWFSCLFLNTPLISNWFSYEYSSIQWYLCGREGGRVGTRLNVA